MAEVAQYRPTSAIPRLPKKPKISAEKGTSAVLRRAEVGTFIRSVCGGNKRLECLHCARQFSGSAIRQKYVCLAALIASIFKPAVPIGDGACILYTD
jgi:hypothetical protein